MVPSNVGSNPNTFTKNPDLTMSYPTLICCVVCVHDGDANVRGFGNE